MMDAVKRFRDRFSEPLEDLQERARSYWLGLAPRERLILSILGGLTALLFTALLLKETFGFFLGHEHMTESNLKNVSRIQTLAGELATQRADMMKYERLLSRRPSPFKLSTYVESEAQKYGIGVSKAAPSKAPANASEGEEFLEITLSSGVGLDRLLKMLQSLEETLGVRLVELTIKPEFADPTKLNVVFTIAGKAEIP